MVKRETFNSMTICCFCVRKRSFSEDNVHGYSSSKNIKLFTDDDLKLATKNFHVTNRIGRGGFGTVYKGILKNGTQVAVKQLSAESKQGIHQFLTEIDMITNVKQQNLVELVGCCVQGNSRCLVYEYVENSSLDRALWGNKPLDLDWVRRSAICVGTARGLSFLHEELAPHIVHRDIKASNVLLDKHLNPKIGDFGLAKLYPDNVTHLSTRVAGTVGYLAPEYAMRGQLTKKADVYSFGVLLLEIVSGKPISRSTWSGEKRSLLEVAWELYEEGKLLELVDPKLDQYPEEEVLRCIKVALFCTQASSNRRPTMAQVVDMLTKKSRLNEKLLTPPGLVQDLMGISGCSKEAAQKSWNSQEENLSPSSSKQNLSTSDSVDPVTSSPLSVTDMVPR